MSEDPSAAEGTPKRQFLVHIDVDLIRRTKILAIERHVTASSFVQAALLDFLTRKHMALPCADHSESAPCS